MDTNRILIIEDNILYAHQLKLSLTDIGFKIAGICADLPTALSMIELYQPDALVVDIYLNDQPNGLLLAKEVDTYSLPIVFITMHAEDKIFEEAQAIPNTAFLVKPFHKLSLKSAIVRLVQARRFETKSSFIVRHRSWQEVIPLHEILWLEADGYYSVIQTAQNRYSVKKALKHLYEHFPQEAFVRIARSHFVQIRHIDRIDLARRTIWVLGHSLPIGRAYIKEVKSLFQRLV